ncbi:hypothetical protein ACHWQZ_G019662 [Mnemiopsis leidyi]
MDVINGKGDKHCANEMTQYFRCTQRSNGNLDQCREFADAIRRCMNKNFRNQDNSSKHIPVRTQQFLRLPQMLNRMRHLK